MDNDKILDYVVNDDFAMTWMELYRWCEREQEKDEKERNYPTVNDMVSINGFTFTTNYKWLNVLRETGFVKDGKLVKYDFEKENTDWYQKVMRTLEVKEERDGKLPDNYDKKINPLPEKKSPRVLRRAETIPTALIKEAMISYMENNEVKIVHHSDIVDYLLQQGKRLLEIEKTIELMLSKGDIYEEKKAAYKITDME